MGLRSLYEQIAFPNHDVGHEVFEPNRVSERERACWQRAFERFLQGVLLKAPGMLVLKSPMHVFRLPFLMGRFKDARFVHIVRDPYDVFPSTVHMWRSLYWTQGLQRPKQVDLDRRVFETFKRFHAALDLARPLLNTWRFHELRFEDLCAEPVNQMHRLYDTLGLGGFERVESAIAGQLPAMAAFTRNQYVLSTKVREDVARHWGDIVARYGYEARGRSPSAAERHAQTS